MKIEYLILLFINGPVVSTQSLLFESSMRLTALGTEFQPNHPTEWLVTVPSIPSVLHCAQQCNQNRPCRTFDYDRVSSVCRLFEGEFSTGTIVTNGTSPSSRIGYVVYTADLFASYNQTCDQCNEASNRYLQCLNNVCQCLPNTYWDGQMCLNQLFNGSKCNSSWASCRQDFNLTCSSQTNTCVAVQVSETTDISRSTSILMSTVGTSTSHQTISTLPGTRGEFHSSPGVVLTTSTRFETESTERLTTQVVTSASSVCHNSSFKQPPVNYATGSGSQSLAVGDFNGDQNIDVAITNYGGNNVGILFGLGNGSFRFPAMTFSANGTNPYGIVAQDFNGDGKLDLAMCNEGSNSVTILLGMNNGSFQMPPVSFSSGGSLPSAITAGDFNGDNRTDLALTNTGPSQIRIFLGQGNGSFRTPGIVYAAGSLSCSIIAADFNVDGKLDLAVVSRGSNQLMIFRGIGNGSFQLTVSYTSGLSFPYNVQVADFNGDSKLDLVVCSFANNSFSIFLGTGAGNFTQPSPAIYATGGVGPIFATVGDFNRDSKVDIASSNQLGNSVTVYLGNGNGTFGQQRTYMSGGQKLQAIIAEDLDKDGLDDLVVANQDNSTISIMFAQCTVY